MDDEQARELGRILRKRREHLGLSLRTVVKRSDVPYSTVLHFEEGRISAPAPDKLARIAAALGLQLADIYALTGYAIPDELPALKPYLRSKYGELPPGDIDAIERYAARLAKKHGISLTGPVAGEDEQ
ncbi:MAG: family transcriptional regulator [Ilumatobacteraceae bacterium]|nr:family transcriptional regulator [Ilumatobacteraceae bacterium]